MTTPDGSPIWSPASQTGTSEPPRGGCPHCSNPAIGSYVIHSGKCPKVAEVEYYPDGMVRRIRFHPETI